MSRYFIDAASERVRDSFVLGLGLVVLAITLLYNARPTAAAEPELVSVKKIWDQAPHNAFTDLIRFKDQWYCTFREADDHVGGDGQSRVLVSLNGETWRSAALVSEEGIDLRDPKLSITADGRLMMVMGGSVYRGGKKLLGRQPRVAFSVDGTTWTPPERVLEEGHWLWRVIWHDGRAYGASYTAPAGEEKSAERELMLFSSSDGKHFEKVADLDVTGRPNETTLRFLDNGDLVALVRRELADQSGWIGTSRAPYREWKWKPIGHRLGGPNFIPTPDGSLWAGSRIYPGGAKTVLARMTRDSYEPVLTLPSGGDNSYPGLVWHEGLLWMSYYSSHEGKTSIYLAKIRLPEGTP